ncbi:MAG: hypothetical protein GC185_09285 [Alphaproteobacteria bacterium]|nr:hypothetical protein [Alphaproteobacteria bacterium]
MTPDEKLQALCDAAVNGDCGKIRKLVAEGADVNGRPGGKDGPLIQAAQAGQVESLRCLLELGALIDGRNSKNSTALMVAAYHGRYAAVEFLAEMGADRTLVNEHNETAGGYAAIQKYQDIADLLAGKKKKLTSLPPDGPEVSKEEISYSHKLDNRVLQEIFNFARRERVSLLRRGPGGMVEVMNRESFAELADKTALRRAFDDYREKGGKISEEDVFFQPLKKGRLMPRIPGK